MMTEIESQLANTVLMVRPVRFQQNPQTAESNNFMSDLDASPSDQQDAAVAEFEALRQALLDNGIGVVVFDDTREPHTPDSVFPNNWVSTHADGQAVLYPMEAPNRRTERRRDIIDRLSADYGYDISEVIDLSHFEKNEQFLEGTGSLVLDRWHRVAYACLSSRTSPDVLEEFGRLMGYEVVAFHAVDRDGFPIYHTNVMMSVGEVIAPVCVDAIFDPAERAIVIDQLERSGHDVLRLSFDQLESFAGNMLELRNLAGERVIAMSQCAFQSLSDEQRGLLSANGKLAVADISSIEESAGGSVRCMLAEIHLPRRQS